jgi:hypothetical protein
MEISLVLSNDSGTYQAILGQFISTEATAASASAASAAQSAAQATAVLSSSLLKANNLSDLVDAPTARNNLSAAKSGANSDITSLSGLTTALSIAQGGTGQTSQGAALSALLGASLVPIANGGTNASTASAARTNLGLGTAATQNTGTSGATIPLLNGANTWAAAQAFAVRPTFNGATPWDSTNLNFAVPPAIGGTTPATGAFTTLSASSTVSGAGFSTYLASPPAIGTTSPAAGKFTTLQTTGAYTPSSTAGIVGTTTNDNAQAGSVGEYQSVVGGASISMSNSVVTNMVSMSLTAGDWDVESSIQYQAGTGATVSLVLVGVSTTSGATGTLGQTNSCTGAFTSGVGTVPFCSPVTRLSLSATTTVYSVGLAVFSGGTCTGLGMLRARRVR